MTLPHVMEEPIRVIASEYMLFLGFEGFYTYGFFGTQFILHRLEHIYKSILKM